MDLRCERAADNLVLNEFAWWEEPSICVPDGGNSASIIDHDQKPQGRYLTQFG